MALAYMFLVLEVALVFYGGNGQQSKRFMGKKNHSLEEEVYSMSLSETQACLDAVALAGKMGLGRASMLDGSFHMAIRAQNDLLSGFFRHHGYWEIREPQEMTAKSGHVIPAGGTLLDIGANLGYYSLLFASRGYKVIAVEPMAHNRAALEASLCMNPELKQHVTIVPAALVAPEDVHKTRCVIRAPDIDIHVHKFMKNVGNGVLTCGNSTQVKLCDKDEINCEAPPVKSLDMVLAELKPSSIDVVKMDVEDFECHVLNGGQSLFTNYNPGILQIETESKVVQSCVADNAARHGYQLWDGTHGNANTIMVKPFRTEHHESL